MEKIKILRDRKRDLEAKLADISRLIQAYEELDRELEEVLAEKPLDVVRPSKSSQSVSEDTELAARSRSLSNEVADFQEAVRIILQEAIRPVERSELFDKLADRDISVGGQEPLNTLAARVFRMADVKSRRGKGYYLQSREQEFFPDTEPSVGTDLTSLLDS